MSNGWIFKKNSPLLLKEGPGLVVFVVKPNQKSNKTLLTAKKSNKIIHTLSKTSILYNNLLLNTAKRCYQLLKLLAVISTL